tara:strand:+ start:1687 stop:2088 length:402 start_codon:yes stop_codon:yes gene_type:complete
MNRFISGTILGFTVGLGVAATQAPPKVDPCGAWKFDVAVLEAAVLTLSGGDMEKYSNVMSNMGWAAVRAVKRAEGKDINDATPTMYKWESSKMTAWERRQLEQVRDNVHLECVLLVKEEADKKIRQEQINNIS